MGFFFFNFYGKIYSLLKYYLILSLYIFMINFDTLIDALANSIFCQFLIQNCHEYTIFDSHVKYGSMSRTVLLLRLCTSHIPSSDPAWLGRVILSPPVLAHGSSWEARLTGGRSLVLGAARSEGSTGNTGLCTGRGFLSEAFQYSLPSRSHLWES